MTIDKKMLLSYQLMEVGRIAIYEPASNLVSEVTEQFSDPTLPETSRLNPNTLIRIVNRARASYRSKDPVDTSLDSDHINTGTSTIVGLYGMESLWNG